MNNREYQTAKSYLSESLAREGAAITAYTICRDFSANDGMYPAGFAHNGVLQGNPVPVGSGRHQRRQEGAYPNAEYRYRSESDSSGSRSGGSSPDYLREPRLAQVYGTERQQTIYHHSTAAANRRDRHAPRR